MAFYLVALKTTFYTALYIVGNVLRNNYAIVR